ncbi:MAG: hypothetical protein J0L84_04010 [Verrucomicrobia bacterium]|nr:hypothetical protein [Verrucomicrobiota bacterium]
MSLGRYDATRYWGTVDWEFFEKTTGGAAALYRGKGELFIGFRAHLEDGVHHGWIYFSRPDTHFTTLFRPVAYDWNPIPDAPIRAGLPPEIPLHPEVTPEGLRLHWHPSLASWILEFREALGGDAPWQPVEGVIGVEALIGLPAQAGYYRLRRP